MLQSVRAGGLAAAAFVMGLFGASAPVHAQVTAPMVTHAVAQVPGVVTAPAATPLTPEAAAVAQLRALPAAPTVAAPAPQQAPVAPQGASLEQLAANFAATAVGDADSECLATAVYFEARGEPLAGQLAVAEVVLNRAASGRYPPDVCAVVKQPAQFSFVRHGQFPAADRGSDSWRRAVAIAKIAKDKLYASVSQNVLWYHAAYVAPGWSQRLRREARIGLHIFYS